jgi:hypothetical protein
MKQSMEVQLLQGITQGYELLNSPPQLTSGGGSGFGDCLPIDSFDKEEGFGPTSQIDCAGLQDTR